MLGQKYALKLNSLQINLISFLVVSTLMVALLIITIGYRHTMLGIGTFAGIIAIGLGMIIFLRPQIGTYILVVSSFTNASSILIAQGWPGINKPLITLVFLGVMAHHFFYSRVPLPSFKATERFMLAYGSVWLASAFVSQDRRLTLDYSIGFMKDFILLLCIVYPLTARPDSWKRTVWLIILTATVLAGLGAYQILSGDMQHTFFGFSRFIKAQIVNKADDGQRLIGPIDDPNFYGQALASILPLAIYRILDEKKFILKLTALLSAFLLAFAILYTYSRGAFLAVILSLLLIALERRVRLPVILLVGMGIFVMMQFLPEGFIARMQTLSIFTSENSSVQVEPSFRGRSSEMQTGMNIFMSHPLLGVGKGNYVLYYQDYARRVGLEQRTEERQAHSLYLEIAAETGIFGLITFAGMLGSLFLGLHEARRKLKISGQYATWAKWITSLQIGLSSYLFTSIFLHGDYIRYLWLLMAVGIALIHLVDHLSAKAQATQLPKKVMAL